MKGYDPWPIQKIVNKDRPRVRPHDEIIRLLKAYDMYVKGSMKSRQTIYVNMWEISAERERNYEKKPNNYFIIGNYKIKKN